MVVIPTPKSIVYENTSVEKGYPRICAGDPAIVPGLGRSTAGKANKTGDTQGRFRQILHFLRTKIYAGEENGRSAQGI